MPWQPKRTLGCIMPSTATQAREGIVLLCFALHGLSSSTGCWSRCPNIGQHPKVGYKGGERSKGQSVWGAAAVLWCVQCRAEVLSVSSWRLQLHTRERRAALSSALCGCTGHWGQHIFLVICNSHSAGIFQICNGIQKKNNQLTFYDVWIYFKNNRKT